MKFDTAEGHVGPLGYTKLHANRCTGVGTHPQKLEISTFWQRVSPRGEPFDRVLQFLGACMRLTTVHKCLKFDVICFTDYRVVAEKPSISHYPKVFHARCRKNCVGSKNDCDLS